MSKDPRTRAYVAKRKAEGRSTAEIMRCLKRYVAREIYRVLHNPRPAPMTDDLRPQRLKLHITQTTAAQQLGTWPTVISRVERGLSRDRDLTDLYRVWLDEQSKISA